MENSHEPLIYRTDARRTDVLVTLAVVWCALLVLFFGFDARWWIVLPLWLITLPAVYDAAKHRKSELRIDDTQIYWKSGSGKEETIFLNTIELVGIRIRLDLSRRARLNLRQGGALRIPPDCTPPGSALETAFAARDVPIRREFFG